jgi:hypothetical protein
VLRPKIEQAETEEAEHGELNVLSSVVSAVSCSIPGFLI